MTAPFECEVRFPIPEIAALKARLRSLGSEVRRYALTDHYYRPRAWRWDDRTCALRIREHREPAGPSELLLTRVEIVTTSGLVFKRSLFPEGKLCFHRGRTEECARVCEILGFEPWLDVVKSDCGSCDLPGLGAAIYEWIEGLGWMGEGEVDGADPGQAIARLREMLRVLGVDPATVADRSIAVLIAERRGLPSGRD